MRVHRRRVLVAIVACLVPQVASFRAPARAQTPTVPPAASRPKYSGEPADALPNMLRSLQVLRQALTLVTENPGRETGPAADRLTLQAYELQRAAHAGIGWKLERHRRPEYTEAMKVVGHSRKHLLLANTAFRAGNMKGGLDALLAAMTQTRLALALID